MPARKYEGNIKQRRRQSIIQHEWGFTEREYIERLADQNFACAICGLPLATEGNGTHLDHDHATGKIREFLCRNCNRGLGYFHDDLKKLEGACLYIEKHSDISSY